MIKGRYQFYTKSVLLFSSIFYLVKLSISGKEKGYTLGENDLRLIKISNLNLIITIVEYIIL